MGWFQEALGFFFFLSLESTIPEENALFSTIPVAVLGLTSVGLPWVSIPESFAWTIQVFVT